MIAAGHGNLRIEYEKDKKVTVRVGDETHELDRDMFRQMSDVAIVGDMEFVLDEARRNLAYAVWLCKGDRQMAEEFRDKFRRIQEVVFDTVLEAWGEAGSGNGNTERPV